MQVPQLVIFGLEYTLWPFYVGTDVEPPFTRNNTGTQEIYDVNGKVCRCYPEVPTILRTLHQEKVKIAISSICLDGEASEQLVSIFGWDKYVKYKETDFITYQEVFDKLHKDTKIDFSNMLFFDDLESNIRIAAQLGIEGMLAKNGMTLDLLEKGIKQFQSKRGG